ncbi:hypothetical protein pb186bvf_019852 [Paramecium bursaria]
MVIQQIPILPDLWTFIPAVEYVAYFTFAAILISIQLLQEFCQQVNQILFKEKNQFYHFYFTFSIKNIDSQQSIARLLQIKRRNLLLAIILIIIYVRFIIYIPKQRSDEVDLRLSQQIVQFRLYNLFTIPFQKYFKQGRIGQWINTKKSTNSGLIVECK